jgi:nitric oxide reductase large subunit
MIWFIKLWLASGAVTAVCYLLDRLPEKRHLTRTDVFSAVLFFLLGLIIPTILLILQVADFWEWLGEDPEDE